MFKFTMYNASTGAYCKSVFCTDMATVELNTEADEIRIEGDYPENTYLKDGSVKALPPTSADWMSFDYETEEWKDLRTNEQRETHFQTHKKEAIQAVLNYCTQFENTFVTPLPSQMEKYRRKEEDGRAYLRAHALDPNVDVTLYPWVASEVGITAPTAYEVAQIYVNLAEVWTSIACRYDPIRIYHSDLIATAQSEDEVDTVLGNFRQAMESLIAAIS